MSRRLCLGRIVSAHGIKGLVKVICFGEDPQSLEKYGPLFTDEKGGGTLRLAVRNPVKGGFLAQVEGVSDRNGAEALRGTSLYVERESLPEPEEGQYYYDDLIGLEALDPSGEPLGRVISVQNFGAGDLLEIAPPGGKAFLVPFVKDFVGDVDLKKKNVIVFVPEDGKSG